MAQCVQCQRAEREYAVVHRQCVVEQLNQAWRQLSIKFLQFKVQSPTVRLNPKLGPRAPLVDDRNAIDAAPGYARHAVRRVGIASSLIPPPFLPSGDGGPCVMQLPELALDTLVMLPTALGSRDISRQY